MHYSILCLGDSYTIGEAVPLTHSFPYQTVQLLRKENINLYAPEVIAKTGWTTDELATAMQAYTFLPQYEVVTLLIGVNNQYRGRSLQEYGKEFENLLQKAVQLAGGNEQRVFVLSIPDYSVTPFAAKMDVAKIEAEINAFNDANQAISEQYGVHYINITEGSKAAKNDVSLIAEDGLHPSALEYRKWATQLAQNIKNVLC